LNMYLPLNLSLHSLNILKNVTLDSLRVVAEVLKC
jgi:hypothetical protein